MEKHNRTFEFVISAEHDGLRLDKALAFHPEIATRSRAQALIDSGSVWINGKIAKASVKVSAGNQINFSVPPAEPSELTAYDFPLDILFEDADVLVINKPAGLVVHPAAGHAQDTLVNALLSHTDDLSMKFNENRPGIVHRLDKDTSGVLVVAKNDSSHENLTAQFKARTTHRIYWAITLGAPAPPSGTIYSWIARHPSHRKKMASLKNNRGHVIREKSPEPGQGKWAVTHYKTLQKNHAGLAWLELKLETGRTHQIRVHMTEQNTPVLGDSLYGADRRKNFLNEEQRDLVDKMNRFALHATELAFDHPSSGKRMSFSVPWPSELIPVLKSLNFKDFQK